MAIFTSFKKYFEITGLSFNSNIITVGEETNYSISIKNVSGKKISSMRADMRLYYKATDDTVRGSESATVYSGNLEYGYGSISWENGATKTFTGKFTFVPAAAYPPNITTRLLQLFKGSDAGYSESYGGNERLGLTLNISTNATFSDGSNTDIFFDLRGENSEHLYVIDARYKPSIITFMSERSIESIPNDEGENLLMNIHLGKSIAAKPEVMSLYLYYQNRENPTVEPFVVTLTGKIEDALASEIQEVLYKTLDKNSDWDLLLWFGDKYESTTMSFFVSRAFANVHLSGASTGGVCFGSFSKATEGKPLFQCYYPAEFESGIKGGFTYQSGEVNTGGKWIDGKSIYRNIVEINVATVNSRVDYVATLPNVDVLMDLRASITRTANTGRRYPACFWYSDSNYHSIWLEYPDSLSVKTSHAITGYVIIEYTKLEEASA